MLCKAHLYQQSSCALLSPAAAPGCKAQAEEVFSGQVWPDSTQACMCPLFYMATGASCRGHCHWGMEANPLKPSLEVSS